MKDVSITNNDATSTLTLHDHDGNVGYTVRSIEGLEFPNTRTTVINRSGEHGIFIPSAFYGERRVTIEGKAYFDGTTDYQERRRDLESILQIERDSDGLPELKYLNFTTQDDVSLRIAFELGSPLKMAIRDISSADFQIDMIADFYIESQSTDSESFSAPYGGGFILPVILPIVFSGSSGANKTVTNSGTGPAWPTLTFTGPITNPHMTNDTIGKAFGFTYSLGSGDTITVNMREKTAQLNGITSMMSNISTGSEWWWLDSGDNDIIFTSSGGSSDTGTCDLEWRDTYLGA